MRQLHHFYVDIVGHVRGAVVQREQFVDPCDALHHWKQFRLRPENYAPGDSPNEWRISDELDRIAEAVVASNQDTFIDEPLAIPDPLEMSWQMIAPLPCAVAQHFVADSPRRAEITTPNVTEPRRA